MDKERLLALFKALSDETRINIVSSLLSKDRSVMEIVDIVQKSQPNISLALKILREAGIVEQRKESRFIFYKIKDKKMIVQLLRGIK